MTLDAYNLPDSEPTHRLNLVRTQPVELPRYDVEVVERTTFKDPEVRNGEANT